MPRYIDADKLQLYLNDYALQVSPSESDDEKTRKWNEIVYMTIDTCMKAVDEQPTADVRENVHAKKVIGGGERDGSTCWFECSICHGSVDIEDAYCKHCGAVLEYEK